MPAILASVGRRTVGLLAALVVGMTLPGTRPPPNTSDGGVEGIGRAIQLPAPGGRHEQRLLQTPYAIPGDTLHVVLIALHADRCIARDRPEEEPAGQHRIPNETAGRVVHVPGRRLWQRRK